MRKFVWGLIALASLVALQGSAEARERRFLLMVWDDGRPVNSQQQVQPTPPQQETYYYRQEQRPGLFDQMMEVERRKNAWLRQTFFGY